MNSRERFQRIMRYEPADRRPVLAIDREIQRLMPVIREGGYLPALDDVVPPEVPLEHYRYFVNALRHVTL